MLDLEQVANIAEYGHLRQRETYAGAVPLQHKVSDCVICQSIKEIRETLRAAEEIGGCVTLYIP